ncbi:MAG: SAM-dependent methyltransferase [Methanocorpusculum sp.]|nr:SAM-dependent methyltransferase [Methanocorpusculum sp.]
MSEPWVDKTRRPYCRGDTAYVPVFEGFPFDEEIPERIPYKGHGYQKLGDTILIHGEITDDELVKIIEWEKPACVLQSCSHEGVMRIPCTKVLLGTPHDVTFCEAGISYTMNPSKVMFSQGNRNEKLRIRSLISHGERIADMFAGIGYFTLSAALAGGEVHAMEINPDSYEYLLKNISLNNLKNIRAEPGDCRNLLDGVYDRILMGHFDAPDFLENALKHVHIGTVLHVHGLGERSSEILKTVDNAGFSCEITERVVKKYSANLNHNVWDVKIV